MVKKRQRNQQEIDALKALVTVYGPREAARMAGIPFGTVASYCFKYQWKKVSFAKREPGKRDALTGKDAGDVLAEAFQKHKEESTFNLAQYVKNASERAARHGDPLEVARKVRDVAGVHQIIFPREEEGGLIEGAILIGTEKVELDVKEIEAAKETIDVRAEIQDTGSGGD